MLHLEKRYTEEKSVTLGRKTLHPEKRYTEEKRVTLERKTLQ